MEDKKNNTEQTHTGAAHARPSQQQETQGDEGHGCGIGGEITTHLTKTTQLLLLVRLVLSSGVWIAENHSTQAHVSENQDTE